MTLKDEINNNRLMNYSAILEQNHVSLPTALVDLDLFDENVRKIAQSVAGTSLTIRIATKSVRVPELIRRVLNSGEPYKGLMCYSAREALFLSKEGFDDFLIAYPTLDAEDLLALWTVHESGKKISIVVDDLRQIDALQRVFVKSQKPFPVLLEPDLSLRIGPLVIGVRRSPLRDETHVVQLAKAIANYPAVRFAGLMAYEAQVAGVPDRNPFKPLLSILLKPLRRYSAKRIAAQRKSLLEKLRSENLNVEIFNGGGTGSLSFNRLEANVLSELTAGSGFYCPHLFSYYSNLGLTPAAFFALQVVRQPERNWYTCQGGGYIASGEPSWDRVPTPANAAMKFSSFEAAGEVQTPIETSQTLALGSAVLFRHAKAGELMERFNETVLVQNGQLAGRAKTYRGFGQSYF